MKTKKNKEGERKGREVEAKNRRRKIEKKKWK